MFSRWFSPVASALVLIGMAALPAGAATLTFERITGDASTDVAGQLLAEVTEYAPGVVEFHFYNTGTIDAGASICDVYFDDGTLLTFTGKTIVNGAGVSFGWGASPGDLPGGADLDPPFEATEMFNADSNSPTYASGIGAGEDLWIRFDGVSYDAVMADFAEGGLRVGLHVQGIDGAADDSDSFVNHEVPEPGTLGLLGLGILAAAAGRKARKS